MIRTVADLQAPVRAAVTLTVVGIASVLAASVLAPTVSAESVLMLAALSTATTAMLGSQRLPVLPAARPLMLPARWADDVLPRLAGRSTDVDHHPQRPRAPGLV